ncbi:methyltransferase C-terminal domain-containing protein [Sorangium sp. So ce542]|uniref:methyltransferase C-terminal domain-containing protein n=1 Tax=Sorangium sp. So ce542 TaxID=3133316 RepID=UPI003F5DBFC4
MLTAKHGCRLCKGAHLEPFLERGKAKLLTANNVFAHIDEMATFRRFAGEVEENRRALIELLSSLRRAGKRVAGYGAPAKGNTLLNHFGIGPETLEYIVDDNPLKQGLYTPGMHIPVVSAREIERRRPDYLLPFAWSFARPVMESQRAFAESGGKLIVPVPTPTVIG